MRVLLLLAAVTAYGQSGFDVLSLNRAVDPCGNFYKFACGGWQAANPIPGDVARWGSFDALADRNRTLLQNVLEAASADRAGRIPQHLLHGFGRGRRRSVRSGRSGACSLLSSNRVCFVLALVPTKVLKTPLRRQAPS